MIARPVFRPVRRPVSWEITADRFAFIGWQFQYAAASGHLLTCGIL